MEQMMLGFLSVQPRNRATWIEQRLRQIARRVQDETGLVVTKASLTGVPLPVAELAVPQLRGRRYSWDRAGRWEREEAYSWDEELEPTRGNGPLVREEGSGWDGGPASDLTLPLQAVGDGPNVEVVCRWSSRWEADWSAGAGVATGFPVAVVPENLPPGAEEVYRTLRADGWSAGKAVQVALRA